MEENNIIDLSLRRNPIKSSQAKLLTKLKREREAKQSPRIQPERLIWAREMHGFSEADWAEIVGVSLEDVQSWEEGKGEPSAEQLETYCMDMFLVGWFYEPVVEGWPSADETTLRFH